MGFIQGEVLFRVHNGGLQFSTNGGTSWGDNVPGGSSVTLGSNNAIIDVPVISGDGMYNFDFVSTVAGGGLLVATLRVNGAAPTTPLGNNIVFRSSDNTTSIQTDTAGTLLGTRAAFGATTVHLWGQVSVRSGQVCTYAINGHGRDGTFRITTSAVGTHNPGSPLTSIGVTSDGTWVAGSVLRVTKSSS